MTDQDGGQWMFKPQGEPQSAIDAAASATLHRMGLPTPVVYAASYEYNGKQLVGSVQPLVDASKQVPRNPSDLTPAQREQLQTHQVGDRLIANLDSHRGQFLIHRNGTVIAVDKGEAMRFFPSDSLEWRHGRWPRYTRPSVYDHLFSGARAKRVSIMPKTALDFARHTSQGMDAQWLASVWRAVFQLREQPEPARGLRRLVQRLLPARRQALTEPHVTQLKARLANLESEFERLYFERSGGLW